MYFFNLIIFTKLIDNNIGDDGLLQFGAALEYNHTILVVCLSQVSPFTPDALVQFANQLNKNVSITRLTLSPVGETLESYFYWYTEHNLRLARALTWPGTHELLVQRCRIAIEEMLLISVHVPKELKRIIVGYIIRVWRG